MVSIDLRRVLAAVLVAVAWLATVLPAGAAPDSDAGARPEAPAGLEILSRYIARPEPAFGYVVRDGGEFEGAEWVELTLTSQTWRDMPWRHQLYIIRPPGLEPGPQQAVLFIDGGKWRAEYEHPPVERVLPKRAGLYREIAGRLGAPVAVLKQVPNQPLFGGLKEDALIALTLERYLETGDTEWPLLLPMVKSAVAGMDAIQRYARERWSLEVSGFTVAGASKRGWTTWLTAAADVRVRAIVPMVFDVLNMGEQMEHQRESWGAVSEQIGEYEARSLTDNLESPAGARLRSLIDPYSYRDRITQPKVVIYGTNDRYWPVDSSNLYWNELRGPRLPLYVPNQGHKLTDVRRVFAGLNAVHQYSAHGRPLPDLGWELSDDASRLALTMRAAPKPARVRAWVARAPSRDFREARWRSVEIDGRQGRFRYAVPRPKTGYVAVFGEAIFGRGDDRTYVSTLPAIVGPRAD